MRVPEKRAHRRDENAGGERGPSAGAAIARRRRRRRRCRAQRQRRHALIDLRDQRLDAVQTLGVELLERAVERQHQQKIAHVAG